MTPQLILILVFALDIGIGIAKHGQPKEGNHNVVTQILGAIIFLSLTYWGGFFDKMF